MGVSNGLSFVSRVSPSTQETCSDAGWEETPNSGISKKTLSSCTEKLEIISITAVCWWFLKHNIYLRSFESLWNKICIFQSFEHLNNKMYISNVNLKYEYVSLLYNLHIHIIYTSDLGGTHKHNSVTFYFFNGSNACFPDLLKGLNPDDSSLTSYIPQRIKP